MSDYRLYSISKSNRVAGVEVITCDTDEEAIQKAKQLMAGGGLELWEGPRFIIAIK